ncbi:MAG TPA: helix-turn-helix domain-containing protein [Gammaproteobacteria bacterium]|nr:helix-turn-helix domain-containing protein [Gammaproteobacteria bacterium]
MTRKSLEHTLHEYVSLMLDKYFEELEEQKPKKVYEMVMTEVESALLKSMLDFTKRNQSKAAEFLGLSRSTLRKKLRDHDYNVDE